MFSERPIHADPLSEIVQLLHPRAAFANVISGKGNWAVRYSEFGLPSFCIMLEGECLLSVDGLESATLRTGDFVLLPQTPAFTLSSFAPAPPVQRDPHQVERHREQRYGEQSGTADMRSLGGAFLFDNADSTLLVSLLPKLVHVRDSARLSLLVQIVREESDSRGPGSELMLSRLMDVLLLEAMRSATATGAPPGLLRGLADERLARALKSLHAHAGYGWTINELARIAALSRSAFFDRFTRLVGVPPMEYLLTWRMTLARDMLRAGELTVAAIAERVGYASTSAFSVAFNRHAGLPPSHYAKSVAPPAPLQARRQQNQQGGQQGNRAAQRP